jgi:hypothetical protein
MGHSCDGWMPFHHKHWSLGIIQEGQWKHYRNYRTEACEATIKNNDNIPNNIFRCGSGCHFKQFRLQNKLKTRALYTMAAATNGDK